MKRAVPLAFALLAVAACKSLNETTNEAPIIPSTSEDVLLPDEDCELYWYQRGSDATRAVWAVYRLNDASALLKDAVGDGSLSFRRAAQTFDLLLDNVGNFWRKDFAVEAVAAYYRDFTAAHPDRAAEVCNDDLIWWALACLRASRITNDKTYQAEGQGIYDRLWSTQVDNALDGGMWRRGDERTSKGANVNFAAVVAALNLYAATQEVKYALQGRKLYQWACERLFDPATGAVYDGLSVDGTRDEGESLSNIGLFLGASLRLYRATGTRTYLSNALKAADRIVGTYSERGLLKPMSRCADGAFNGVAMRYLAELARRPSCARYRDYLLANARTAWTSRRLADGLNGPDWSRPPLDTDVVKPQSAVSAAVLYFATSRAFR